MLSLIEAIVGPGDERFSANPLRQQQLYHEELKRREKARERREWQEAAKTGVASYDRAKASDRGAVRLLWHE